jgi:ferredoxin
MNTEWKQRGKTVDQKIGVLLCKCEGEIAKKIDLTKVSNWLNEKYPLLIVKTYNALCKKPNEIGTFIKHSNIANVIVGACSKYQELFEEIAVKAKMKPFCLKTVSLLQQCALIHSPEDATEKAKIILLAAVSREKMFEGVSAKNLKLTRARSDRKMDRRSFLTFPFKSHPQIIPTIEMAHCVGLRGCNLCIEACPKQAVSRQQQKIQIDISKCEGCGICMVTCPVKAILFPTPALSQINEQIHILVSANGVFLKPRIILFTCTETTLPLEELASKGYSYPPNMLIVEVPCIGTITPFLILQTLEFGAEAVALIAGQRNCVKKYDHQNMKKNVQTSRELLKILGVDPKRICAIDIGESDLEELHTRLNDFSENIAKLGAHNIKSKEPNDLNNQKNHLLPLVKHWAEENNVKTNTKVYNLPLPFWAIEVDAGKCSFCGSCASHCPTNAISLKQEDPQVKLIFNYSLCMACGLCHKYCPEKAIDHENIFDLQRLCSPEYALIMAKKTKCECCGSWFLPQKQIEKILSRVSIKSEKYSQLLSSYCPNCRLMADSGIKHLSRFQKKSFEPSVTNRSKQRRKLAPDTHKRIAVENSDNK